MKRELEEQIISKAPYMFQYEGSDDIRQSLISFGFECGGGWFWLLKKLVEDIAEIDVYKAVKVFQVKEKFGALRFYISYSIPDDVNDPSNLIYDKVYELINKAEEESGNTCEQCGEPGSVRGKYWLRCECDKCENERINADTKAGYNE
jgi:hypothetical protein